MTRKPTETAPHNAFKKLLAGGIFFLVIIAVLEWGLGLLDLSKYDRKFMPGSAFPIFVQGKGAEARSYVTSPHFAYQMNTQSFAKKKPAGVTRIFVVGGSAAYAWPYTEEFGFSGLLRRALATLAPGQFELINAAGMSYGSHRVLDVLKDVVNLEPDLVLVYSGNNEYVERNVLPSGGKERPMLTGLQKLLGRTNLYRALRLGLARVAPFALRQPIRDDLTDIRSNPAVRRGNTGRNQAIDQEVLANLRSNLTSMRELLRQRGIPAIFCTIASNVAGWSPTSPTPAFAGAAEAERWQILHEQVAAALGGVASGDATAMTQTVAWLREMQTLVPSDPETSYNLGQVLMAQGLHDQAYVELVRARDLDARPIRDLSAFNDTVRELTRSGSGVFLADIDEAVAGIVRSGFAEGIFLDYCHFTENAHKFVAVSLLPVLAEALGRELPTDRIGELIKTDDWGERNKDDRVTATEYYARGLAHYNNGWHEQARDAFLKVLELTPKTSVTFSGGAYDNLGYVYLALGDAQQARIMFEKSLTIDPGNPVALIRVGHIYLAEKRLEQAAEMFQRAIQQNPLAPEARSGLGEIALARGLASEAIGHFLEAQKQGWDNLLLRRQLGRAYQAVGKTDLARESWQAALRFSPNDQETATLLNGLR